MTQPIYRYHAQQKDGWRFHYSPNPNMGQGWIKDGVAFNVPLKNEAYAQIVPINQFHCVQSQKYGGWRFHFHRDMSPATVGWTHDKVAFYAFSKEIDNTIPIYQYHAEQEDGCRFFFTSSPDAHTEGWTRDSVAFFAYPGEVK